MQACENCLQRIAGHRGLERRQLPCVRDDQHHRELTAVVALLHGLKSPGIVAFLSNFCSHAALKYVFTVSEADLARLQELHANHYQEMRRIIAASANSERVVLANLQLIPLDAR